MQKTWTDSKIKKLRREYPVCDDPRKLAKRLRVSYEAMKSKAGILRLKRKKHAGSPWTPVKERKLIKIYSNTTNAKIAEILGLEESTINSKAFKLGLFKSPEFKRACAIKSAFSKGHVPLNKGKKQTEYMSKEAIAKTEATRFKKGQSVWNEANDGDIRVRHDHPGRKDGRALKYIRIKKGIWQELQRYNWEKKNGPIPKGYILACKDGNTLNCAVSNWYLMTKADNARRNAPHKTLPDNYIAGLLAGRKNPDLKEHLLRVPALIQLKRKTIINKRKLNGKQY